MKQLNTECWLISRTAANYPPSRQASILRIWHTWSVGCSSITTRCCASPSSMAYFQRSDGTGHWDTSTTEISQRAHSGRCHRRGKRSCKRRAHSVLRRGGNLRKCSRWWRSSRRWRRNSSKSSACSPSSQRLTAAREYNHHGSDASTPNDPTTTATLPATTTNTPVTVNLVMPEADATTYGSGRGDMDAVEDATSRPATQ